MTGAKRPAKSVMLQGLDVLARYWPILSVAGTMVIGFVVTFAMLPSKLHATEVKVDQLAAATQAIEHYIEAMEKERELRKHAPPGWLWSESDQQYLPDKEYHPKKGAS